MARSTSTALALLAVVASGGGVWWLTRPDAADAERGPVADPDASPPVGATPDANRAQGTPTAAPSTVPRVEDGGAPPAVEAVASVGERLPAIALGGSPRAVRLRPEALHGSMDVSGAVVLAAFVEARVAWVRWDREETRARFLAATITLPPPHPLPNGEMLLFVEELAGMISLRGFSTRLEGSTLRIGAEGVYPRVEGDAPGAPDGPPGPSPR